MPKTTINLSAIFFPILLVGTLQLGGCFQREIPPPGPGGIFLSTSGGANFNQSVRLVNSAGELTGYVDTLGYRGIHRPPHLPQTIYSYSSSTLLISEDNGQSWQGINHPLSLVTGFVRLPNDVMLIAGSDENQAGVVSRSLDRGQSWAKVLSIPGPAIRPKRFFEIIKPPPPPPVFVSTIQGDPFNEEQVYVATSTGDVLIGGESGKTWRTLTRVEEGHRDVITGHANAPIREITLSPHQANEVFLITTAGKLTRVLDGVAELIETPGSSILDVLFVNQFPDALIISTNKGSLISRDRGVTWVDLELPISKTSPIQNNVTRISPTNPARIIVGIDDILYRSEDGGETWHTLSLGLPNHIITDISIDPSNAANVLLVTTPKPS